jgi:GrpB-like predicted nucleotidyltransferase (UPF0157 family)
MTDELSNRISSTVPGNAFVVTLVEYDPTWPIAFHEEAIRVLRAAKGLLVGVDHIGSTSVPGLAAKPTLDMLAEVNQTKLDPTPLIPLLDPIGYRDRWAEFNDRLLFSVGRSGARTATCTSSPREPRRSETRSYFAIVFDEISAQPKSTKD